jgi:large subunit ribosomal protein L24
MNKIRKGDTVEVTSGDDTGKRGRVLKIITAVNKAVVEGVNLVKKHKRKTQQDQKGGVVSIELPMALANLSLVCKQCNRPVRIGFSQAKDGSKARVCRRCKENI